MEKEKLYNFIEEIIKKSKQKGFSSEVVNEKLDTLSELLCNEGKNENLATITMLKKYIPRILSNELKLLDVLKVISFELSNTEKTVEISKVAVYMSSCGSVSTSRCGVPLDRCGFPVYRKSVDRCGMPARSCGSSRGSSRC